MSKCAKFEDDLLPVELWKNFYHIMPRMCQEVVDGPPECLGIGRNEELGWFIAGSGQGPCICWVEKKGAVNEVG